MAETIDLGKVVGKDGKDGAMPDIDAEIDSAGDLIITVDEGASGGGGIPLVLSPHLWEPGKEYDFGDGSFGQRFVGTITAAANSVVNVTLLDPTVPRISPISCGGWVQMNGSTGWVFKSIILGGDSTFQSNSWASLVAGQENSSSLGLYSKNNQSRTNVPYDIWVRYTKG